MKKFLRSILVEEWVALVGFFVLVGVNAIFFDFDSIGKTLGLILRYFTFGAPAYATFFLFVYFLFLWKFYHLLAQIVIKRLVNKEKVVPGSGRRLWGLFIKPIRLLMPLVIVAAPFSLLLSNLNYALRFSGKDWLLVVWDRAITKSVPFISVANALSADWLAVVLKYFYISLAGVMSVGLILLFIYGPKRLYRQAVLSFILSLLLALPFFAAVPCQDPHNYFVRNLRGHNISNQMQATLAGYTPGARAVIEANKIATAETVANKDNAVPVSCFPSMHSIWTLLTVYFLFLLWPWTLVGSLPWLILSLTGGIYFGQHYFVDYLAGVVIFLVCVTLSRLLLRMKEQ